MKTCAVSDSGYATAGSDTSQEATFQARRIRVSRLGTELNPLLVRLLGESTYIVVNQHASMGEESDEFLRSLGSTVLIVPSWAPSHPAPDVLKRIMNSRFAPSKRLVFATDLREAAKIVIGQRATQLAGPPGHVVVRVNPGGETYRVFVLENQDERDLIAAIQGPFLAY